MWASTVPDAMAALLRAFNESPELSGVTILDGPRATSMTLREVVLVGNGNNESIAAEGQLDTQGLTLEPDRDQYGVNCQVSALRGKGDLMPPRTRAFELFALVSRVLKADQTLGGAVMNAHIGRWSLMQSDGPEGAVATVVFTVEIDAFTHEE